MISIEPGFFWNDFASRWSNNLPLSLSFSLHVYYFIFLCFVPLLLFDSYQFSIIVFSQSLNFDWLRLNFCLIFFSNLNHYLCLNLSWVLLHLHSSTHPFILINIFSLSHSNASISPHFTFFCVTKSCLFLHVSLNKSIKHFITYLLIRTRMSTLCLGTNPFVIFTYKQYLMRSQSVSVSFFGSIVLFLSHSLFRSLNDGPWNGGARRVSTVIILQTGVLTLEIWVEHQNIHFITLPT